MKVQITERVTNYVTRTKWEDIPAQGINTAKEAMLDCLGCILLGATQKPSRIIIDYLQDIGAKPQATVIGQKMRTACDLAALANGIAAHAEDYDDISIAMLGHPSAPIFPAALAAGEIVKASGQEIIAAYIIGFEVATRLGLALGFSHYNRGWHGTATTGTIAAAAASARLLGLDETQTRMALALAASLTCGLRQNFGTMTKPWHAGNAARSGVTAALLVKKGFTADLNILEAPLGYYQVFRGENSQPLPKTIENLGETYEIVNSGIALKPYPSCGETHAGIEIMLNLRQENQLSFTKVNSIECVFNETMNSVMLHHEPKTGLEGKFSIEYCVARALLDGKVGLEDFTDARVNQPEIREIIKKVKIQLEPSFPMMTTTIKVTLDDGRILSGNLEKPKGYPENPLSHAQVAAKYKDCAQLILSESAVNRSLALMENLEKVENIGQLMQVISG